MEHIIIGGYDIILTGKADGSAHEASHRVHSQYLSVQQIHAPVCVLIDENYIGKTGQQHNIQADALISSTHALGTYTADCLPIVILGRDTYAVVHGSWKTLSQGIIETTVKKMCRHGEGVIDMCVYIGPSIRNGVYEVGQEFLDIFPATVLEKRGGRLYLDMVAYTISCMIPLGIPSDVIQVHPDCTYEATATWFSYRRGDVGKRNFLGVRRR